jgi:hypothetical protein
MLDEGMCVPTLDAQTAAANRMITYWKYSYNFIVNHFHIQAATTSAEGTYGLNVFIVHTDSLINKI